MKTDDPIHSPPVIEARNLVKTFRDFWRRPSVKAVRGISFEVRPGEVFGLLGPNGSGKSTTIKMLLGLLHPTSGDLRVLGQSPSHVATKARIGFLPEESLLYPHLSCEETLLFFGSLFNQPTALRRERARQLLAMIGLEHARSRPVSELSKGMARRVGLAQALINDPDLIILDEPTAGLDPPGCRQVKDLIVQLARRGKTILLTSHLLADVEDVCDRVGILYNGILRALGRLGDLLEDPARLTLSIPEPPPEVLRDLLARLRDALRDEPQVSRPRRSLEQYFLDVVEQARRVREEDSGAAQSDRLAPFLEATPSSPPAPHE